MGKGREKRKRREKKRAAHARIVALPHGIYHGLSFNLGGMQFIKGTEFELRAARDENGELYPVAVPVDPNEPADTSRGAMYVIGIGKDPKA